MKIERLCYLMKRDVMCELDDDPSNPWEISHSLGRSSGGDTGEVEENPEG